MGRIQEAKTLEHVPALQQMRTWHKSMARMVVAAGKRPSELSRIFGLTPAQVTRILESPLFVAEVARLEGLADYEAVDMSLELQLRQGQALKIVDEILFDGEDGEEARVSLLTKKDMALEILDRTGYGKNPGTQKHLHLHKHEEVKELSDSDLDARIKSLMKQQKMEDESVVAEFAECLETEAPDREKLN